MMLKTIKVLLIAFLVLILILAAFRHNLCRLLITRAVEKASGLKLVIADLNLDIIDSSLYLRNVSLFNPPGFEEETLTTAKAVYIKYDLLSFLQGKIRLHQLKAELGEIKIIKNKQGKSNVGVFKTKKGADDRSRPKQLKASSPGASLQPGQPRPKLMIDYLELSLEKITYINRSAGIGQPAIIIFAVREPLVMNNVTDLNYVVESVSTKSTFKNMLTKILGGASPGLLKNTGDAVKEKIGVVLPPGRKINNRVK